MIPISSIWIGERLSCMERLCIRSYLRFGHPFRLYAYGTPEGVPAGTELVDAGTILPESAIFRSTNGAVGDFANFFKASVLLRDGGCWTEMDEVCLRPWDGLGSFISSEAGEDGSVQIDQAAISIEPGHALMAYLVESCERRLKDNAPFEWGTFGVTAFQAAVKAHGLESRVLPPDHFCPLPWWKAEDLMRPGNIPESAYGIQLWNEAWRRKGWDKDTVPKGSLYEKLTEVCG